jgi:hypothetical protein
MVVQAVLCEPVSTQFSLLNRDNAGRLNRFWGSRRNSWVKTMTNGLSPIFRREI